MKFKHSDIEIPREDPFKNCKLNRQPNAISKITLIASSCLLTENGELGKPRL